MRRAFLPAPVLLLSVGAAASTDEAPLGSMSDSRGEATGPPAGVFQPRHNRA